MHPAVNLSWDHNLNYVKERIQEAMDREDVAQANMEDVIQTLLVMAETMARNSGLSASTKPIRDAWYAVQNDPGKQS